MEAAPFLQQRATSEAAPSPDAGVEEVEEEYNPVLFGMLTWGGPFCPLHPPARPSWEGPDHISHHGDAISALHTHINVKSEY